ncbi:MAG: energy transducer TonB [Gemmatimonadaceae bacterium]
MLSLRLRSIETVPLANFQPTVLGRAVYTALSVALHATLVLGAVALNDRAKEIAEASALIHNPSYLAPPNRHLTSIGTVERVHFVRTDQSEGVPAVSDRARPAPAATKIPFTVSNEQTSSSPAATTESEAGVDSVYSVLDVDSAARRYPWSAAPVYPRALLEKGIEGAVVAEYVVDSTGVADTASFHVFNSTHADFTDAVRTALPNMRFAPAKIGALAVRLLVQQTFTFRVQPSATARDTAVHSTAGPRSAPPPSPPRG